MGRSTVTCQTLREPESHPYVLINLSPGLHRMYKIRSWTLYVLERKGCRDLCMAHLNEVNHAASTALSKSQEWKHLLTWQQITRSSVAREVLWQQLLVRRWLCSAKPLVGEVQRWRFYGHRSRPFSMLMVQCGKLTKRNFNRKRLRLEWAFFSQPWSGLPTPVCITTLNTVFFPIPNKEESESHPVSECMAGPTLQKCVPTALGSNKTSSSTRVSFTYSSRHQWTQKTATPYILQDVPENFRRRDQHSGQRGPEWRGQSSCRGILDLTFNGYFNTCIAGITSFYFHQNNGCIGFIIPQNI